MNSCDNMLTSSPKSYNAEDSLKVKSLGAVTSSVANIEYDYQEKNQATVTSNFTLDENFYPNLLVT